MKPTYCNEFAFSAVMWSGITEAIVNPVNCVGVCGKGLALEFKKRYPENYSVYSRACKNNQVVPGEMLVFTGSITIINFPTKRHWKDNSRLEDIDLGLQDLVRVVKKREIGSIAVPKLGCGLGKLTWEVVHAHIIEAFSFIPNVGLVLPDLEVKFKEPKTQIGVCN